MAKDSKISARLEKLALLKKLDDFEHARNRQVIPWAMIHIKNNEYKPIIAYPTPYNGIFEGHSK